MYYTSQHDNTPIPFSAISENTPSSRRCHQIFGITYLGVEEEIKWSFPIQQENGFVSRSLLSFKKFKISHSLMMLYMNELCTAFRLNIRILHKTILTWGRNFTLMHIFVASICTNFSYAVEGLYSVGLGQVFFFMCRELFSIPEAEIYVLM